MIEKLDIIDTSVYCYDEQYQLIKTLDLSQFQDINFTYLEGSKLFTLNITQPIKRVVKFTEINGIEISAEFIEYPYDGMTVEQKSDFDNFIQQAENL